MLGVAAVGVVGLVGTTWGALTEDDVTCGGAAQRLIGVWDDTRREQVASAIRGVTVPYAAQVSDRTRAELDRYASQWTAVHTEACEATQRDEQTPEVLDLRMSCLDRARDELSAVTELLADADRDVVDRAHRVVSGLPILSACSDIEALQADIEPPRPEDAAVVDQARTLLARAKAARTAGRHDAEAEAVAEASAVAAELDYAPLQTELTLARAWAAYAGGDYEAARTAFDAALTQATDTEQHAIVGEAASMLVYVVADRLVKPDEALADRRVAEGAVAGDPIAEASLQTAIGSALEVQGNYDEAIEAHRRSLELREAALGPDHHLTAIARGHVAGLLGRLYDFEQSLAEHRAVLASLERSLGADHPMTAGMRHNLGVALHRIGDNAAAEVEHRRAMAARIAALGADHPRVGSSHDHLALVLAEQGKDAEAEAEYRKSIEITERAQGPDAASGPRHNLAILLLQQARFAEAETEERHAIRAAERTLGPNNPELAGMIELLAHVQRQTGDLEGAMRNLKRSLDLRERAFGPDHGECAGSHANLGVVFYMMGKLEEAEAEERRALELAEASLGPDHPQVSIPLNELGRIVTDRGRADEGLRHTRRALELIAAHNPPGHPTVIHIRGDLSERLERAGQLEEALELAELNWSFARAEGADPYSRGTFAFRLARLLWQTGDDRDRVAQLVSRARADFDTAGEGDAGLEAWLRERGRRSR